MEATEALGLLAAAAPAFGISATVQQGNGLRSAVPVLMVDGSARTYDILVSGSGDRVSAREATDGRALPAFCPIRHINVDGSFCLNWDAVESLPVHDASSAEAWWGVLLQFLRLQKRAGRLRRWPDRREWAHGGAAKHQKKAHDAAAAISPRLLDDVARARVTVKKSRANSAEGTAFRLEVSGKPIVRVFVDRGRPATLRQACPCMQDNRPLTLRRCRDHASRFVELVGALNDIKQAEARFWRGFKGHQCCGTMDGCPLAITP